MSQSEAGMKRGNFFRRTSLTIALPLSLIVLLAACSGPLGQENTESPMAMTSQQAEDSFKQIARASCDAAMAEGVVERSEAEDGFVLVMVPKNEAYKDFSAAYFQPEDTYELIWETDAFSACGAAISFDLAEEAGQEADIEITFNSDTGQYETFQDFGEFGVSRLAYQAKDGLIVSVTNLESADSGVRTVTYGGLSGTDIQILETAADKFLANQ